MDWIYKHIPTICFIFVYYLTVVPIHSLVEPKPNCQRSSSGPIINGSHKLERVSGFEPCSPDANEPKTASSGKLLKRNQTRVHSMKKKVNHHHNDHNSLSDNIFDLDNSDYGWFTVKISLGTPQQDYNLIVDTGSPLTWVRCLSCTRGCDSTDPLYDPSKSLCKDTSRYPFSVTYDDNSFTKGIWGCDNLSIEDLDPITNFQFGCGQVNVDDENFVDAAGFLGLGRGELSLTSQSDGSMQVFSYFVPENGVDADLHFGDKARAKSNTCSNQFTPLVQRYGLESYCIDLVGISVAGIEISVPSTRFMYGTTIIDSGTIISRLPEDVYYAFRDAFRQSMLSYTLLEVEFDELLDTCYDIPVGNLPIVYPEIQFHFGQESTIDVTLKDRGIIWKKNETVNCLAFAATERYKHSIIGIVQQRGFNMLYDLEEERIGFGTNCAA